MTEHLNIFTQKEICLLTATGLHTHPANLPRHRAVFDWLSNVPAQPFKSQFWAVPHVVFINR